MEARQNSTKFPLINQDFVIRDSMINNPNFTNRPSIIKDEKKGIFKALLAFMTFGLTSFHIKLTKTYFPAEFESNLFMLWRSISCVLYSYLVVKYQNEKIFPVDRIKSKKWFYIRCYVNYLSIISLVLCMMHLRAATAACMSSLSPAIVIFFSIFILNEKFHIRYVIGIAICFIGTAMIVLNEKKGVVKENDKEVITHDEMDVAVGIFFGICHVIFNALIAISQKIIAVEKIPIESVCFYIGFSNIICSIACSILTLHFRFDFTYAIFSSLNGISFYYSNVYINEALQHIDLSKTTPLTYVSTLIVFLCGVIFIGEMVYLTDVIGSLLILSYNVYNSMKPH
jgi:drug/metabolite transporter (DMT)-like permease